MSDEIQTDASLYGVCWCGRARGVRTVLIADTPEHPWEAAPPPHEVLMELVCLDHGVNCEPQIEPLETSPDWYKAPGRE